METGPLHKERQTCSTMALSRSFLLGLLFLGLGMVSSFQPLSNAASMKPTARTAPSPSALPVLQEPKTGTTQSDADETTEKYGLEVGLFQSLKKDDGGESAKSLLTNLTDLL